MKKTTNVGLKLCSTVQRAKSTINPLLTQIFYVHERCFGVWK